MPLPKSDRDDYVKTSLDLKAKRFEAQRGCRFNHEVFTDMKSLLTWLATKLETKKQQKKHERYYVALRLSQHWLSLVFSIGRHKPRCFILDSTLSQFTDTEAERIGGLMAKHGGHVYHCNSGVQKNSSSCSTYALSFLFKLAKYHPNIFAYLNLALSTQRTGNVTKVDCTFLPPELVKDCQDHKLLAEYLQKSNFFCLSATKHGFFANRSENQSAAKALQAYVDAHEKTETNRAQQVRWHNDGIAQKQAKYEARVKLYTAPIHTSMR